MKPDCLKIAPLLTVAIPTYNRADLLDLCLTRIEEEISSLNIDQRRLIKLYVSNNASTDHTSEVIRQHQLRCYGEFEVVSNPENIGGERNVAQCYVAAKTPYVWILGDDDVILKGKLQRVLDVLAEQQVDILYVNGYSYSGCYLDEPARGRGKTGVIKYTDSLDFVRRTHIMLTFITALIVRSGANIESSMGIVAGSNLPQLGWVFQLIREGNSFVFMEDRVFAAKIANSGGYGAINVFGSNLFNIANSMLNTRPELAKSIQNGAVVMWFPTYIMNLRQGDAVYAEENVVTEIRRVFHNNWRYYFFIAPLISLPITFARLYFIFIRLTRHIFRHLLI